MSTPRPADPSYAAKLSQAQADSPIRAAGISVSSSGWLHQPQQLHLHSFEQINDTTVNGIITLKRASGCALTITGGTRDRPLLGNLQPLERLQGRYLVFDLHRQLHRQQLHLPGQ